MMKNVIKRAENLEEKDLMSIDLQKENNNESLAYDDNETETNKATSNSPRTTYFHEANSILRDVKNKFLPHETKLEKVRKYL